LDDYIISPIINGLSDHDAQLIVINSINLKISNNTPRFIRNINKRRIFDFKISLSLEMWDNVFENNDINLSYNFFLNTYLGVYYSCFPLRKWIIMTNDNAWITTGIQTSCKYKRELYLICKNSKNFLLKNYYKLYCKILSNIIQDAKKYYFSKQIENSKNKIKTTWDITRLLTGIKTKNEDIHQLNINGNVNYNFQTIPDLFNNYFISIMGKNHSAVNKNNNFADYLRLTSNKPFPNIKYQYTSTKEIEKIISSLKSKNSHGYDEISVNILKFSSPYISSPLCHICNKMFSTGIFPERLKYAVIKPIFKNGDRNNVSNYRPISLLPAFSKVFEKVLYVTMYQHLINNDILVDNQFGFRPKSSTMAATFSLINEILKALN